LCAGNISQFRSAIQGGATELSRVAEEGLALLRGELQVSCFYHLHGLSQMKSVVAENGRTSFVTSSLKSHSGDEERERAFSIESESVIAALHQHVFAFQRAVLTAHSADMMAVLISPLCSIIPKILSICAKELIGSSKVTTMNDGSVVELEGIKPRFLRAILACQQMLYALLEDSKPDPRLHRILQDIASEDFEIARRVAEIIDNPEARERQLTPPPVGLDRVPIKRPEQADIARTAVKAQTAPKI
jgi:hypothetical protein